MGELVVGGHYLSQISDGQNLKMAVGVALNTKRIGQIAVRTNSFESIVVSLNSLIPCVVACNWRFRNSPAINQ